MREILFRGKRLDNGKWVEGYLYEHQPPLPGIVPPDYVPEKSRWYILQTGFADWNIPRPVDFIEVDPETVGQDTGLKDKNGKRIFTGGVVKVGKVVRSIRFRNGAFEITGKTSGISMYQMVGTDIEYEVIGNIHDNPELLKED